MRESAGARQHHRVRRDAAFHAAGAALGSGSDRSLSSLGVPRHERGGAQGLQCDPQGGNAEERPRADADARRSLRDSRLSRLRAQARRIVRQREIKMNEAAAAPKAKKSVALSGVPAGNTALCTVGRSGNDLHYRGYDILDFADAAEFEEIAYLLVHEKLPTAAELAAYKAKLKGLRGLPAAVRTALEARRASAHPMAVMRTRVPVPGTREPENEDHGAAGARDLPHRPMASRGSMLLYWHHFSRRRKRI